MKQNKRLGTFLSGLLAGAMLVGGGTAAFAAANGSVAFGSTNLAINGDTVITAGERLTTAGGAEIPSTIVYTDEQGGGTTYLPIRTISELLDIPVDWADGTIYLGYKPSATRPVVAVGDEVKPDEVWETQPLHQVGAQVGPYTEVEPYWPDRQRDKIDGYSMIDRYMTSPTGFVGGELSCVGNEGGYCSISVTNHNEVPLILSIRCHSTITSDRFPFTVVPAGETVIRTFHAGPYTGGLHHPIFSVLLRNDDIAHPHVDEVSATFNVVYFDTDNL